MIKLNLRFTVYITFILIMFCTVNAQGETTIPAGSIVETTWTASGSPYLIEGDLLIAGLTIEPGVRVEFTGNYVFEVGGTLTAEGTENEPIVFTSAESNTESWQGIYFNECNNQSSLKYAIIEESINSGIRILNSLPTISYCTISNNYSPSNGGGGLYIDLTSLTADDELIISGCTISENTSSYHGGGINANVGPTLLEFTDCIISNNISNPSQSNGNYVGGGLRCNAAEGRLVLNNSQISNNSSYSACTSWGCSVTNRGGGIYINGYLDLSNSIIQGNYSYSLDKASGGYEHNYSYGAGLYQAAGNTTVINSIISNNICGSGGTNPTFRGGGIYIDTGMIDIINSTIAFNENNGIYKRTGTATVLNSIIYFNTSTQIAGTVEVTYSDVQDGFEGEGNITSNPIFKSETDLIIVPGSLCIDAGNPDPQYNDECFPFSLGTQRNDMGAHGGPGGCDWSPPGNVAYYYISVEPIVDLWQYELEMHAITYEGEDWILGSAWSIPDNSIAVLEGNTLTGLQNGHVIVSTNYMGTTYSEAVYFKSFGYFESESNDTAVNADFLTENEFMEGELLESDIDTYKLEVSQFTSAEIAFFSRSLVADVLIEVLDNSENVIASATSIDGESIRVHVGLRSGEYYIKLSNAGDIDDDETYDIVYGAIDHSLGLVFEAETNDTISYANDLMIEKTLEGRLSTTEDQDFFRVQLNAPVYADLVFQCQGTDLEKQFNIAIYNSSEENLINSFIVNEGNSVALPMGLNIAEYFIKVSGVDGFTETVLPYTLKLMTSDHSDIEIESNNTIPFANPLAKEQAKTGIIYSAGDVDIYGFEALQIGTIHVDFTPTTTTGDYKISILDKNGNEKYNKTSVDGDPRTLHYGIETPDYYYVKVEVLEDGDIDSNNYYELLMTSDIEVQPIIGLVSISIDVPADHIAINEQVQLTLKRHFSDTTFEVLEEGDLISLQPAVAAVDSSGIVTGLSNGNATIVGVYEGFTAKVFISVGSGETAAQHHGNLIIMTGSGTGESDPLTGAAQYLSDLVYKRFQNRLFQNEDIYYLNPVSYHDLDGDGYDNNIVDDSSPTVDELGQVITDWAAVQSTDGPLFVYMVGHGEIDTFSFPEEIMTATQLKDFIDSFQISTGRRVVVIIEACKSGTFTNNLVTDDENIIVVTSADDQDAYLKLDGKISFSQFFMDSLRKGDSIYESWLDAKDELANMESPFNLMNPQLLEGASMASSQTWVGGDFVVASLLPGWVLGKVYDDYTDVPIGNASVYIEISGTSSFWDVNTADDGYYFCEVPAGTYDITITAEGYESSILSDVYVGLAEILTQDFGLISTIDTDGDDVPDGRDNCPGIHNPDQIDGDEDGSGDECDLCTGNDATGDSDSDGDCNDIDEDDDDDGMPDEWEELYDGLNPLVDDADGNLDRDNYTNYEEYLQGSDPSDRNDPEQTSIFMPWLPLLLEDD